MRPLFRVAVSVLAVSAQPPNVRDLFPGKPVCHLPFKEQRVGRTLFQIVGETRTGKELFRIRIGGLHEKEWLTWWSYGVKNCGGFNRDGVLDYSWSGGGTSHGHYLILSTPTAHRIIGIEKTFEREWTRGG